jgi:hypothetical protein
MLDSTQLQPILLVRKAYGSLRMCIDYRGLHEVTRKDAYTLPRVDDTLDELKGANFYTHLDFASGFWQLRVRDPDVRKTALKTHDDDLMEWIAMPFGLCNATTTFLRMMNDILREIEIKMVYNMYRMRRMMSLGSPNKAIQESYKSR